MLAGNNSLNTKSYFQARPTNRELSFSRSYLYNNQPTLLYKRCEKITAHNHSVTRNDSIADFFVIFSLRSDKRLEKKVSQNFLQCKRH